MSSRRPPPIMDSTGEDFRRAVKYHHAGRLDKAAALYRKIIRDRPNHGDALNLLGVITLDQGQHQQALELFEKAVRHLPKFAGAHSNLGNAQFAVGAKTEALESYRRAISLDPLFAMAHANLAMALNAASAYGEALESATRATQLDNALPEAHFNKATALRGLGRFDEAISAFEEALRLRPGATQWQREYALYLSEHEQTSKAIAVVDRLIADVPDDAANHIVKGSVLYQSRDMPAAVSSYRRATTLSPGNAQAWIGVGRAERARGHFKEAEAAFRRAMEIAPTLADSHRNLALIGKLRADDAEVKKLSDLLDAKALPEHESVAAGFTLGKLLDENRHYEEAFARYRSANSLYRDIQKRSGHVFDVGALKTQVSQIIQSTPHGIIGIANDRAASELPVFVVGMPRSGTSLVEQIIASHSKVFGAGESRQIGNLVAEWRKHVGSDPNVKVDHGQRLAESYLATMSQLGRGATRVVDKMLDNIFLLKEIAELFPKARVIFCRRDPADTCVSCYFTLFRSGNIFSYDLTDCANRFRETSRLMDHWQKTLPLKTLVVPYETLVKDFEQESRRLIEFLELDWEPACLNFHETERAVVTASSWQVRQPLTFTSIGRWRHYAPWLGELGNLLEQTTT